ncbi:hypothetical protein BGX31_007735 [Mortierella sp. GBA43]|nr:hypothetical protein BGX31_007735 [Mortierella sp. GBA43]
MEISDPDMALEMDRYRSRKRARRATSDYGDNPHHSGLDDGIGIKYGESAAINPFVRSSSVSHRQRSKSRQLGSIETSNMSYRQQQNEQQRETVRRQFIMEREEAIAQRTMELAGAEAWRDWCSYKKRGDGDRVTPQKLLEYIDDEVIPKELSQLQQWQGHNVRRMNPGPSPNLPVSGTEAYVRPVLQLWQDQSASATNPATKHSRKNSSNSDVSERWISPEEQFDSQLLQELLGTIRALAWTSSLEISSPLFASPSSSATGRTSSRTDNSSNNDAHLAILDKTILKILRQAQRDTRRDRTSHRMLDHPLLITVIESLLLFMRASSLRDRPAPPRSVVDIETPSTTSPSPQVPSVLASASFPKPSSKRSASKNPLKRVRASTPVTMASSSENTSPTRSSSRRLTRTATAASSSRPVGPKISAEAGPFTTKTETATSTLEEALAPTAAEASKSKTMRSKGTEQSTGQAIVIDEGKFRMDPNLGLVRVPIVDLERIPDIWTEWHHGWEGGTPIRKLYEHYGSDFRNSCPYYPIRVFYTRRRLIVEIEKLMKARSLTSEQAVAIMETTRNGYKPSTLIDRIAHGKRNYRLKVPTTRALKTTSNVARTPSSVREPSMPSESSESSESSELSEPENELFGTPYPDPLSFNSSKRHSSPSITIADTALTAAIAESKITDIPLASVVLIPKAASKHKDGSSNTTAESHRKGRGNEKPISISSSPPREPPTLDSQKAVAAGLHLLTPVSSGPRSTTPLDEESKAFPLPRANQDVKTRPNDPSHGDAEGEEAFPDEVLESGCVQHFDQCANLEGLLAEPLSSSSSTITASCSPIKQEPID